MRGVEKLIVILLLVAAIAIPACVQKETRGAGETVISRTAVIPGSQAGER